MEEFKKGPWSVDEDRILVQFVRENGPREWSSIRSRGLLPRTGKSCRLRWVNKLRPGLKTRVKFSPEEEKTVLEMQAQIGNKWASIAKRLPGRTDNDVKNFWSIRKKRLARLKRNTELERETTLGFPNTMPFRDDPSNYGPFMSDKAGTSNVEDNKVISCVNYWHGATSANRDLNEDLFSIETKPFPPYCQIQLNQPCFSDPFSYEPLPEFFELGQTQTHSAQPAFDDLTSDMFAAFEMP